jgi:hypothetical protein
MNARRWIIAGAALGLVVGADIMLWPVRGTLCNLCGTALLAATTSPERRPGSSPPAALSDQLAKDTAALDQAHEQAAGPEGAVATATQHQQAAEQLASRPARPAVTRRAPPRRSTTTRAGSRTT